MADDSFHDFVRELFAGLGPITVKRMFGGGGVYAQGKMFALLADDVIYIKTDDALKIKLAAEGSGPFVWVPTSGARRNQTVEMSYWRLPEAALDDPDEAVKWGRAALQIALAAPQKKPPAKRKAPAAKTKKK
jgi:DNA transformation protein and related proteins